MEGFNIGGKGICGLWSNDKTEGRLHVIELYAVFKIRISETDLERLGKPIGRLKR